MPLPPPRYARLPPGQQRGAGQVPLFPTKAEERRAEAARRLRLVGPDIQCWKCRRYFHPARIEPHPDTGAELCDIDRADPDHERHYEAWLSRQIARLEAEAAG